jgi:nucleotide exchange factor SIL1
VDFNQELMEKTRMFSDFELMKIAITDLNNVSTSLEDRYRAMLELLELVEPLNNANGNYLFYQCLLT